MTRAETEDLFLKNIKLAYHVLHRNFPLLGTDEDMQQEALLGLWRACRSFDPNKGNFSTYAGCCVLNQIRYALRSANKQPKTVSLDQPMGETGLCLRDTLEEPCPSVDDGFIYFKTFLEGLSERERELMTLSAEGLTQRQIGEKLGRSQVWVSRTLKRLREDYLKKEGKG